MEKACEQSEESSAGQWIAAWLPVAAYMALIFYFSSLPHPDEKLPKFLFDTLGDKLLHTLEYAVLGCLCYRAFRRAGGPFNAAIFAIVAASLYGASDEVHQAFVPLRTATWSDWVADTAGGVIGAVGYRRVVERGAKNGIS
ncbi:MAG TPA: VanZ family protein [Nitrospira sp.]|nr:VanZ family protein [Nitrospira sp.]